MKGAFSLSFRFSSFFSCPIINIYSLWPLLSWIQVLAAHCSTERIVWARLDGFKNRLGAKDDEIGYKSLEMEALANTLKEAKAENKRLQTELEKGKEARAEVD